MLTIIDDGESNIIQVLIAVDKNKEYGQYSLYIPCMYGYVGQVADIDDGIVVAHDIIMQNYLPLAKIDKLVKYWPDEQLTDKEFLDYIDIRMGSKNWGDLI